MDSLKLLVKDHFSTVEKSCDLKAWEVAILKGIDSHALQNVATEVDILLGI